MSEKRTDDRLLISQEAYQAVLAQLDSAADQIREMQGTIKRQERYINALHGRLNGIHTAMEGYAGRGGPRLHVRYRAKHQPKDNGAGGNDAGV